MAVVGGAILPTIPGQVAAVWNLRVALIVPLVAYAFIAFYGINGHKVGHEMGNGAGKTG